MECKFWIVRVSNITFLDYMGEDSQSLSVVLPGGFGKWLTHRRTNYTCQTIWHVDITSWQNTADIFY